MKKIVISLFSLLLIKNAEAQSAQQQQMLSALLDYYYAIGDALVRGDQQKVAIVANDFIKTANSIDYKIISEGNINALLKDASEISEAADISKQRKYFANLSENMRILTRAIRFTRVPVYSIYCPMKKASWLSATPGIKNPYYGESMLTCGEVVETIRH